MSSDSATLVPTQQSVKAYVDSQVTAQDLDFQADSGGALSIDLDSESLTFTGGTGIDTSGSGNAVTFAIDSTVTTLTGTQTLTNKTLTSPDVNTPDIDGGTIDGATIATSDITVGTGKTLDVSSGTLTLADDQISGDKVEGGTIASTTITSLASTTVDTTNLEVTNIKAKDGTSAGSIADTTGVVTLASSVLTTTDINGGTIDGATIGGTTAAAGSFTTVSATGNITVDGTVDGRDVATDGTKLDGIEALADVTDTTNVTAAGAVMDSELTNETAVKSLDQGVATTDSPTFAGLTTTADVSFGDNDKAIFGAGSDLQIYHDGSNSYVTEGGSGTGNLIVQANNLFLRNGAGTVLAGFYSDGTSRLLHNGSTKLDTTSTGIDVTGTVTADGLTVDGNTLVNVNTGGYLAVSGNEGQDAKFIIQSDQGDNSADITTLTQVEGGDFTIATANGTDRLTIGSTTGDISFYEDTGTTAKFFWDASAESLGIGTSSPETALHLYSTGNTIARITSGTSSIAGLDLGDTAGTDVGRIRYDNSNNSLAFTVATNEAMRIDSSGNLLVGKTAASVGTDGAQFLTGGYSGVSATSTTAFFANRNTTDGDVVEIGKNGVKVGSIGNIEDLLYIATDDTTDCGIRFDGDNQEISPCTATGAYSDGNIDLGDASGRFKDLYLSGGVYLGGTTSANHLDDYETGNFDPQVTTSNSDMSGITYVSQIGSYVKVGDLVWFRLQVGFSATTIGTGNFRITDLPFVSKNDAEARQAAQVLTYNLTWDSTWQQIASEGVQNTSSIDFLISRSGSTWANLKATDMSNSTTYYYIVSGCYQTA